jgi:hypothetical protein
VYRWQENSSLSSNNTYVQSISIRCFWTRKFVCSTEEVNHPRGSFPGGKTTGTWSRPLTSMCCWGQECEEPYLHSTIHLHVVVLS